MTHGSDRGGVASLGGIGSGIDMGQAMEKTSVLPNQFIHRTRKEVRLVSPGGLGRAGDDGVIHSFE